MISIFNHIVLVSFHFAKDFFYNYMTYRNNADISDIKVVVGAHMRDYSASEASRQELTVTSTFLALQKL